jgi:hypothetical protein
MRHREDVLKVLSIELLDRDNILAVPRLAGVGIPGLLLKIVGVMV